MAATDQIASGVPGRYARALYELANETKSGARVGEELAALHGLVDASPDLRNVFNSPTFSADDQLAAVEGIGARGGFSAVAMNFLRVLVKNRRLAHLQPIAKAYEALMAGDKGEVTAEVTSAEPLSAKQLSDLKAALKSSLGQDVQLTARVDDSILGGLIVKAGSKMIDNSLKTKLDNLKIAMKGTA